MKSLLFALAALMLVSCSKDDSPKQGTELPAMKSCVEQQGVDLLRLCFNNDKPAYAAWKECVDAGGNKVKCYKPQEEKNAMVFDQRCSGLNNAELIRRCFNGNQIDSQRWRNCVDSASPADRMNCYRGLRVAEAIAATPATTVPDIECGNRPYICFRYYLVQESQANLSALASVLAGDASSLRQNAFCEYRVNDPAGPRVRIKERSTGYRLTFREIEGEITCNGMAAAPQGDFLSMVARDVALNVDTNLVDSGAASRVQIDRGEIFLLGDMRYFRLKATSIAVPNIAGNFAAIAKSENDERHMIIFDGKFDVRASPEN